MLGRLSQGRCIWIDAQHDFFDCGVYQPLIFLPADRLLLLIYGRSVLRRKWRETCRSSFFIALMSSSSRCNR